MTAPQLKSVSMIFLRRSSHFDENKNKIKKRVSFVRLGKVSIAVDLWRLRLFSFGGYGLALAALALVVFGAYDSYLFSNILFTLGNVTLF